MENIGTCHAGQEPVLCQDTPDSWHQGEAATALVEMRKADDKR